MSLDGETLAFEKRRDCVAREHFPICGLGMRVDLFIQFSQLVSKLSIALEVAPRASSSLDGFAASPLSVVKVELARKVKCEMGRDQRAAPCSFVRAAGSETVSTSKILIQTCLQVSASIHATTPGWNEPKADMFSTRSLSLMKFLKHCRSLAGMASTICLA